MQVNTKKKKNPFSFKPGIFVILLSAVLIYIAGIFTNLEIINETGSLQAGPDDIPELPRTTILLVAWVMRFGIFFAIVGIVMIFHTALLRYKSSRKVNNE